jgi:threonylcarbamoyladenosine tRNA methylthiotransferase MtaB
MDLIDVFVDNQKKMNLVDLVNKKKSLSKMSISYSTDRSRPYIKIQDGCEHKCTYCKVRLARGNSWSVDFKDIVETAEFLALKGFQEIVLTGVNIGNYNYKGQNLSDLLKSLVKIENLSRIRLSSIEPTNINQELLDILSHDKICRYFHLSLQSGSDPILQRMKRPYNRQFFIEKVGKLKKIGEDVIIGTDVIVGFPGESNEDFMQTYNLLKDNDIFYLHVFPFSPRENTEAFVYDDDVSPTEKSRRLNRLVEFGNSRKLKYFEELLKTKLDVCFITSFYI